MRIKPSTIPTPILLGLLSSITLLVDCSSLAAAQVFSDRTAFLAAISSEVVIDFEDVSVPPNGIFPVVGDPWLPFGIVFDQAGLGDNMAIGNGGDANKNIFALGGPAADIDITLTSPVLAFGLGVFSNDQHSPTERILFFAADNTLLANIEMPLTGIQEIAFVGFLADSPSIKRIAFVEDDEGDYAGIGDVAFTPVPEPSSTVLFFAAGLCTALFAVARHRTNEAAESGRREDCPPGCHTT